MTNEQESAVEQQPVLHLYRQPEASEGRGTGMALGMAWGSTICTARLRAAFYTALQMGETALSLSKVRERNF